MGGFMITASVRDIIENIVLLISLSICSSYWVLTILPTPLLI
jgi:hypothetical protein